MVNDMDVPNETTQKALYDDANDKNIAGPFRSLEDLMEELNKSDLDEERYLKSLSETPEPVDPPEDRSFDLHGLYDYISEKGCKVSDLSKEEMERFVIRKEKL